MPVHVVKSGECFTTIAASYGFGDYRTIYNHPMNAALKVKRPNPNVIHPGDQIYIPDKAQRQALDVPTGKAHAFKLKKTAKKALRVVFQTHKGEPLKNAPYKLKIGGTTIEGKTTGAGLVEAAVPIGEASAVIEIDGRVIELKLGRLNPVDGRDNGVSGVQGRLNNLGYNAGVVDGIAGPKTRTALAIFQKDAGLKITGSVDDATKKKLAEIHGC